VTEFQDGNFIVMREVMDCQVHAIENAIRPVFADLVTIMYEQANASVL